MDDELRRLQEQLAAVQMQETAYRLSERNVVEIVLKLLETQKVELIFAKSGREYLTPKQLGLEIEDELLAHGGRVTLVELQPILNVDMNHIEDRVANLLAKDRSLRLVNGQLVTNYYLDGILEETNDALQDVGQVSISSLVQKYSLPAELILEAVNARLGSIIFGRLEGLELYTETFVQRHNGRVRGIFSAISVPVTLRSIIQTYGLLESLTYTEVARLIEDKLLAGSLQGTQERSTYVPFSYARNQKGSVESFFNQNGYIEYSALSKLQISNPQEYMTRTFPSGLKLNSAYLGEVYVEQAVGAVEEAIAENKWTDVTSVLPPPLSSKDVELVVKKAVVDANQSVAKGQKALQMAEVFAVSEGFLAEAASRLQPLVRATAVKSMGGEDDSEAADDAQSETSAASGASAKGKKDAKPAKKAGKGKAKGDDSDEEPDPRSKAKKGGKKGRDADDSDDEDSKKRPSKAKGKKKGKGDDSDDDAPVEKPSKAKGAKKGAGSASISIAAIIRQLQTEFPDVPPELAEAIADSLKPALSAALQEFVKSIATGGSSDRRERLEFLTRTLQETFDHLSVFHRASLLFLPANQRKAVLGDDEEPEEDSKKDKKKGKAPITMLEDTTDEKGLGAAGDPATVTVLQKHILKTTASQAFDLLLECAAVSHDLVTKLGLARSSAPAQSATPAPVHHSVSSDSLASADGKPNTPQQSSGAGAGSAKPGSAATSPPIVFTATDRAKVLGQLPAPVAKPLKLLQGFLAGKSSSEFVDKFEAAAGDCEVRVRKPDKKRERNIVFGVRRGLMSQLEHVPRPELVLHYAVVILHSQVHNAVVHAPSRSIPVLLRSLNGYLNADAAATLTAYSDRVQRLLRASHSLKLQQLLRDERAQAQPSQSATKAAPEEEAEDEEEKKPRGGKRSVQFAESEPAQTAAVEEEDIATGDSELMDETELDKLRQEQQTLATELEADKEKVRALGLDPKKAVK